MSRSRLPEALTLAILFAVAGAGHARVVGDVPFSAEVHQITSSPLYETTPTLGHDGVSYLVVYVALELLPNGFFDDGDIWYQRLADDGSPLGSAVIVSGMPTDDKLNDTSGDYIVFTAYDSGSNPTGSIMLYQISTGTIETLSTGFVQEPRIDGDRVVWVQGPGGASEVMMYDLAWLGTGQPPQPLTGTIPPASNTDIGDSFVVWVESNVDLDIGVWDLQQEQRYQLTDTPAYDERHPATDGPWIAWQSQELGSTASTIGAVRIDTADFRILRDDGSLARRPSISEDLIVYEADPAGSSDVFCHRISTCETFQVAGSTEHEYLGDVLDRLVAFVEASGNEDIYVARLTLPDPCGVGPGDADCNGNGIADDCEMLLETVVDEIPAGIPPHWVASGLWHTANACRPAECSFTVWPYFGLSGNCTFATGDQVSGVLTSPPLSIPDSAVSVELSYFSSYDGESGSPAVPFGRDWAWVEVNGLIVDDISVDGPQLAWEKRVIDLTSFAGQQIVIEARFNSIDGELNEYFGWALGGLRLVIREPNPMADSNGNGVLDDCEFRRGDCNADGSVNIADVVVTLEHIFDGRPLSCVVAADANDDEAVDIGDAIYALDYLFSDGPWPPPPFPDCGPDPSTGPLECGDFAICP